MKLIARLGALTAVIAIIALPAAAVAVIAGNPFTPDLLDQLGDRRLANDAVIKLLSIGFYVSWAWFCGPALRVLAAGGPYGQRRHVPHPRHATGPGRIPKVDLAVSGPRRQLARLARFALSGTTIASVTVASGGAIAATPTPTAPITLSATAPVALVDDAPTRVPVDQVDTVTAEHRDTPYAIAVRIAGDRDIDDVRNGIIALNTGRPTPDGAMYRGGALPAGWNVLVPSTPRPEPPDRTVQVEPGDTLWQLTHDGYGTTNPDLVQFIADFNAIDDPNTIAVGQTVTLPPLDLIPTTSNARPGPPRQMGSPVGELVVADGDNLWTLAESDLARQGNPTPTTEDVRAHWHRLIEANRTRLVDPADPNRVYVGQRLIAPLADTGNRSGAGAGGEVSGTAVRVAAGDTLWDLLQERYGDVDADLVWAVADHNGLDDPSAIDVGQQLLLPAIETLRSAPPDLSASAQSAPPASVPVAPSVTPTSAPASTPPIVEPPASRPPPRRPLVETDRAAPAKVTPEPTQPTSSGPNNPGRDRMAPVADASEDAAGFDSTVRSVWWTIPSGSLLAAGIVVMMRRLRGRRQTRLRPGETLGAPSAVSAGTELAAVAVVPPARLGTLRSLLRCVTPHARELADPPAVRAVELGDDRVEVLFVDPAPFPPAGWTTVDGGRSWVHRLTEPVTPDRQLITPALVTLGRRADGGEVLLDLETAGSVGLVGDRTACAALARSMVLEVATYPLGVPMDLCLIGFDVDGLEHCDRTWPQTSLTRAVRVAREVLERTTDTGARSLVAARAATETDEGSLDPQVFVVDVEGIDGSELALLDELVTLCQPQAGAALIVVGDHATREQVDVDAAGGARWSGAELRAPQVTREAVAQVAVAFDEAARAETVQLTLDVVDVTDTPAKPDIRRTAAPSAIESSCGPVDARVHQGATVDSQADGVDLAEHDTALVTGESVDVAATRPAEMDVDDDIDGLDDGYVPPVHEVLVRMMGEVEVVGRDVTIDGDVELLCLLTALRDRMPNLDTLTTLTRRESTQSMKTRMSRLRARLGQASNGDDLLPTARTGRSPGRYAVSPLVLSDVELLRHRYQASLTLPAQDALRVLADGVDLMRGPAFRARHGYDWVTPEGVQERVWAVVRTYADRLMELAFEADRLELVLEAARRAGHVIDDPIAEGPVTRKQRKYAEASGDTGLLEAVREAHRRFRDHVDEFDRLAD